jgi:hypothetical protein
MINKTEYTTQLLNLLDQYNAFLIDSELENITIIMSIIDDLTNNTSPENLKNMFVLLHDASIFPKDEPGKAFIQALETLYKQHKTFLYWKKIKDAFYAGHLSPELLEQYPLAQAIHIELPPPVPEQLIKPNLTMFKEYRSVLKPEYHPHANAMIDHLEKISFSQLKVFLKKLAQKLNQHMRDKQYDTVCLFHRGQYKSEYWVLKLIYPFLDFQISNVIEIYMEYDLSSKEDQAVILQLETSLQTKNSCLLLIDDGTYSGEQCGDHILHIAYRLEHIRQKQPEYFEQSTVELVFAFAYATQRASNLITQSLELLSYRRIPMLDDIKSVIKKVHLLSEKRIFTTKEMDWGNLQADYATVIAAIMDEAMACNEVERLTMVYTDWKTPDRLSSPASFFKSIPPVSLCREDKKIKFERMQNQWKNEGEHIIPSNFMGPYKIYSPF